MWGGATTAYSASSAESPISTAALNIVAQFRREMGVGTYPYETAMAADRASAAAAALPELDRAFVNVVVAIGVDSHTYWFDYITQWVPLVRDPTRGPGEVWQPASVPGGPDEVSGACCVSISPQGRANIREIAGADIEGGVQSGLGAAFAFLTATAGGATGLPPAWVAVGGAAVGGAVITSAGKAASLFVLGGGGGGGGGGGATAAPCPRGFELGAGDVCHVSHTN